MAETANIAKMAEKLSTELFAELKWKQTGPMNQNWKCEDTENHKVGTHPSDVVFYYDEPYRSTRTYINCDLKSYSKTSISKSAVQGALESLAKQISCAEKSSEWRDIYAHGHVSVDICGLLFIYNHDGEYDKDFRKTIESLKVDKLQLPRGSKIVIIGPEDIHWLDNVRFDLVQLRSSRGKLSLPSEECCRFYYPDLITRARIQDAHAATLEMITSPWIILEYDREPGLSIKDYLIFYRRSGETIEEFMYVIDYLRHYQILSRDSIINIRQLDGSRLAAANFQKARDQYVEILTGSDAGGDLAKRVGRIEFSKMTKVVTRFSDIQIGMDYAG